MEVEEESEEPRIRGPGHVSPPVDRPPGSGTDMTANTITGMVVPHCRRGLSPELLMATAAMVPLLAVMLLHGNSRHPPADRLMATPAILDMIARRHMVSRLRPLHRVSALSFNNTEMPPRRHRTHTLHHRHQMHNRRPPLDLLAV